LPVLRHAGGRYEEHLGDEDSQPSLSFPKTVGTGVTPGQEEGEGPAVDRKEHRSFQSKVQEKW
jgi:hypothetical protein